MLLVTLTVFESTLTSAVCVTGTAADSSGVWAGKGHNQHTTAVQGRYPHGQADRWADRVLWQKGLGTSKGCVPGLKNWSLVTEVFWPKINFLLGIWELLWWSLLYWFYTQVQHCEVCHLRNPRGILLHGMVAHLGTQMCGHLHQLEIQTCGLHQHLLNTSESSDIQRTVHCNIQGVPGGMCQILGDCSLS